MPGSTYSVKNSSIKNDLVTWGGNVAFQLENRNAWRIFFPDQQIISLMLIAVFAVQGALSGSIFSDYRISLPFLIIYAHPNFLNKKTMILEWPSSYYEYLLKYAMLTQNADPLYLDCASFNCYPFSFKSSLSDPLLP